MLPRFQSATNKANLFLQSSKQVFSSVFCARFVSMGNQTPPKVKSLYELCKLSFTPSTTSPPSSEVIGKISVLMDTLLPSDFGLKDNNPDDDRGHGFLGLDQFNRVSRWAQPITFYDIHECDSFTMCIFSFPTSSVIPLHDHPNMTVFSKVLYGSLHVKGYDWVEASQVLASQVLKSKDPDHHGARLAKLAVDEVLTPETSTSVLYPRSGGNLHCFTAVTRCAVVDILAPPYREGTDRICTYYHDYPYSTFSAGNSGATISEAEKDEYAWLVERESPDMNMRQGRLPTK